MSRRETVQLNHVLTQDVKMLYGFTVCCASDQKVNCYSPTHTTMENEHIYTCVETSGS